MPGDVTEALIQAVGPAVAARVEEDTACLKHLLEAEVVRREYLEPVLRGERGAPAELFAAARIGRGATALEPHAQSRGRRRCDALVHYGDFGVFVEVKHQRDSFPFNDPGVEVQPGLTAHGGTRPGADPRYLGDVISCGPTIASQCLSQTKITPQWSAYSIGIQPRPV